MKICFPIFLSRALLRELSSTLLITRVTRKVVFLERQIIAKGVLVVRNTVEIRKQFNFLVRVFRRSGGTVSGDRRLLSLQLH
jgi:hypothetical protein